MLVGLSNLFPMTTTNILTDELNPKFKQFNNLFVRLQRRTTALHMTPVVAKDKEAIMAACNDNPTGSRIGGAALITDNHPWPVDGNDFPMQHLAQLNLAELPAREGYPTSGLLQFFIGDDDYLGVDGEYLVRFIPAEELTTGRLEYHEPQDDYLISGGFFTVTGQLYDQAPSLGDRDFEKLELGLSKNELDDFHQALNPKTNTIFGGGWAYFTQDDPRKDDDDREVLLQLDSYFGDDKVGFMWGDAGVGNFFISPQDLANLDFSNVLYNWDCC